MEIRTERRIEDFRIGTREWGGSISMSVDTATEFEIDRIYWLEQKQPEFLRPEFRRRAKVTDIQYIHDYAIVSFVAVLPAPREQD